MSGGTGSVSGGGGSNGSLGCGGVSPGGASGSILSGSLGGTVAIGRSPHFFTIIMKIND
jgi:hypothetical protein